eukprot:1969596-Karenia_brevis.AAC.1
MNRALAFYDISRAHPHCEMKREVLIDLPVEAALPQGMCARLLRCVYGLRDANQTFELKVREVMSAGGFIKVGFSPCLFHHETREIRSLV